MPYLLIRQKFADYPTWRRSFDELADRREAAGIRTVIVMRNAQDPDEVVVLFEYTDTERVQAHFRSQELMDTHQRAGVVEGSTQATFLQSAD